MLSDDLIKELRGLSRAEKVQAMQILVNDLAQEEGFFANGALYEVWSPYDSAGAADTLMALLEAEKQAN